MIRRQKVDRLSAAAAGPPPEHQIAGCVVLPRTSFEESKGWVVVEGRMIVAPHGADVLADDQVRVDNAVWEVDGAPGDYEDRAGRGKATIFYLTRRGS